jgi:hypothetical protein
VDAHALELRYDGGEQPIPRGSEDARLLESANRRSDMGLGLYATAAALAILSGLLVLIDEGQAPGSQHTDIALLSGITAER